MIIEGYQGPPPPPWGGDPRLWGGIYGGGGSLGITCVDVIAPRGMPTEFGSSASR